MKITVTFFAYQAKPACETTKETYRMTTSTMRRDSFMEKGIHTVDNVDNEGNPGE